MVVTAHPEVYQEVARAPDRLVSAQEGIEQVRPYIILMSELVL